MSNAEIRMTNECLMFNAQISKKIDISHLRIRH